MAINKQIKVPQKAVIREILRWCSSFGKKQVYEELNRQLPLDVPKGHFVVYVGTHRSRYILPISVLTQPEFQALLRKTEEEFGFCHHSGLTIPCEQHVFESMIQF